MVKKHLLTKEGLEKLKAELDVLVNKRRREIIERIQEAVAQGDLSENADYSQAKEDQSFVEGRIQELQEAIKNSEIIKASGDKNLVSIGSTVRVSVGEEERSYTIVGADEANPAKGRISNESLVGQKLIGSKVGDEVEVDTLDGKSLYKVVEIS